MEWIGLMNNIQACAREIVNHEIDFIHKYYLLCWYSFSIHFQDMFVNYFLMFFVKNFMF